MRNSLSKQMLGYIIAFFLIIAVSGIILSNVVTNIVILIAVLAIQFVILIIFLFYLFDKFVKPVNKASETMDKLLQGNYHARIHHPTGGTIGQLFSKINSLARNLSELTLLEQIQSEQLSTVIENSESGLVLIDEKGYIHVVNRKFISMFGKKPSDYIGRLYYDVLENEQIHHTVQETFLYEKHVKHLFSLEGKKEKVYLQIVGAPIFNERNMLRGAVLVIYDITDFKKIETMRKDFVANVSHELKTPITSIKGFAETLLDGAAEDEEVRNQFLHIIYEESKRIEYLIEDLLIISKLEKDEEEINEVDIEVDYMLDDILPVMQQQAEKKRIDIKVDIQPNLTLQADEEKIKQVLFNLIANELSYTPDEGTDSVNIAEEDENITFSVQDTGIGISEEALPRIFERFYRVDKDRSRDTGGTGLGLAIVKHIVEAHNGKIDVDSELDKGTTFKVYIPKQIKED